jgi:hypothetical protein
MDKWWIYLGRCWRNCRNDQCNYWIGNNRYWQPCWWSNICKAVYVSLWHKETLGGEKDHIWRNISWTFWQLRLLTSWKLLNLSFLPWKSNAVQWLHNYKQCPWIRVRCWKVPLKPWHFADLVVNMSRILWKIRNNHVFLQNIVYSGKYGFPPTNQIYLYCLVGCVQPHTWHQKVDGVLYPEGWCWDIRDQAERLTDSRSSLDT